MQKYKEVIMYSYTLCGDCQQLKAFLDRNGIQYETRDIHKNPQYKNDLIKNAGEIAVPYMVLDGKWVIGYEEGYGYTEEYAKKLFDL